jgi:glycosyltransferase involved in cell wall biosynthesis
MYNLLRCLSARHEVRQFSLPRHVPMRLRPRLQETRVTPNYRELRYDHPVAGVANWLGHAAWVGAPLLSGLALRLTRPAALTRLLDWADLVLVEFPWQFEYCRRRRADQIYVLASHNVESLKFPSWARAAGARFTRRPWVRYVERAEIKAARGARLVLAVSAPDREHYLQRYALDPARVVEVPNGADTQRHAPVDPETRSAARRSLGLPDRPTVLYAGSAIPPNRVGADWVRRLAAATDRFTFLSVGEGARLRDGPPHLVSPGFVDDIRPYFHAADMALCPIEHGAGTKIKLLEYMANGLPTVAFSAALHGVAARDGSEVVVAEPSVAALLAAIERLANDPPLAQRIGGAARELSVKRYDWCRIARRLDDDLVAAVKRG